MKKSNIFALMEKGHIMKCPFFQKISQRLGTYGSKEIF